VDPDKPPSRQEALDRYRSLRREMDESAKAAKREAFQRIPRGDHRGRAEELVTAITADPTRHLELAAQAAVAEAMLAVADELAELRQLLTKRLPPPPPLQRPAPGPFPAGVVDLADEMLM
jgi:hypothetical protein